jgi:hypothetical protein
MRRGARKQRVGERFGLNLAGADRIGRLGKSKIVKLRHGCTL